MMQSEAFRRYFESGLDALSGLPMWAARQRYETLCAKLAPIDPPGMHVIDGRIAGVGVRYFQPAKRQAAPVVYIHGGGWTLGSPRSHHGIAADLAERLGREVISIDYRLVPEASYREALDDCQQVTNACSPCALIGDSAGGRLAMDVAQAKPGHVVLGLIYPPVGQPTWQNLGPDAPLLARDDILALWDLIADDMPPTNESSPPSESIEVLAVEHDPLTRPLEAAIATWRRHGSDIGYRCAAGMLHGALHAHAELAAMHDAWQTFCQQLVHRLK